MLLGAGVAGEHVTKRSDEKQQRWKQRQKRVIGDQRSKEAALVVGVLVDNRQRHPEPAVSLLERISNTDESHDVSAQNAGAGIARVTTRGSFSAQCRTSPQPGDQLYLLQVDGADPALHQAYAAVVGLRDDVGDQPVPAALRSSPLEQQPWPSPRVAR